MLDNGSRLAAIKGTRFDNGNIELENAAYTPCPVEDNEGCPKNPSWQVRAVRVLYDKAKNKVRTRARIEIFGCDDSAPGSAIRSQRTAALARARDPRRSTVSKSRFPIICARARPRCHDYAASLHRRADDRGRFRAMTISVRQHHGMRPMARLCHPEKSATAASVPRRSGSAGKLQSNRTEPDLLGRVATVATSCAGMTQPRRPAALDLESADRRNSTSRCGWATQTLRVTRAGHGDRDAIIDYRQR